MKILHLGNPHFLHDFRQLGHDVQWASAESGVDMALGHGLESIHSVRAKFRPQWVPDLIVVGDDSVQPKVLGLEAFDVPLVWYAIDSHLHANWHHEYAAVFDIIFVAQKDWEPVYRVDPDRQVVLWKPLFCRLEEDRCLGFERDIPLSFVGTLNPAWNPERVEFIRRIQERYPIVVKSGAYRDTFNRSMMVLNQSVANDLNFRTMQAMACGALLLNERVGNGFEEVFREGVHCALYDKGNVDQLLALVEHYRAHPLEREAIAFEGRRTVLAAHTSMHRAQAILEVVTRQSWHEKIAKRHAQQLQIQWCLAAVYETSARKYHRAAERAEDGTRHRHLTGIAEQYEFISKTIRSQVSHVVRSNY